LGTLFFSFSKRKEKCGKKKLEEKFGCGKNTDFCFDFYLEVKSKHRLWKNEAKAEIFNFNVDKTDVVE
jgi:hypothetical protein